jgi:transposase InsO family protein
MPTVCFQVLYVLVIISHDRRVIKHVAVTAHPTAEWVIQQFREAMPFGEQPKYLIHDNDTVLRRVAVQQFLKNSAIKCVRTGIKRPQQNGIVERAHGSIRRELLDHLIPINERHLQRLLAEYITRYYKPVRSHQGVSRQTPIPSKSPPTPAQMNTPLQAEPLLGGLYHNYRQAA